MNYTIELTPDDNGIFLVTCPALPEVVTFGESEADCIRHGRDAIEEALAARLADQADIPQDTDTRDNGGHTLSVELPALTGLKVSLYWAIRSANVTRAELTRRLQWNRNSVDRLFQIDHASRLDQIEAAAAALGRRVRVELS